MGLLVFSIAILKQATAHHLLDIGLYVFIYKLRMETLKLPPVVLEYLDKPVFVVDWLVVYLGHISNYTTFSRLKGLI